MISYIGKDWSAVYDGPWDTIFTIVCPECKDKFEVRFVDGFIAMGPRGDIDPEEWERVKAHAGACFKEQHRCKGVSNG